MTVRTVSPDAVGSGLITASADALTFRHDLVRETVYALPAIAPVSCTHLAEYHLSVLDEPLVAASTPGRRPGPVTLPAP